MKKRYTISSMNVSGPQFGHTEWERIPGIHGSFKCKRAKWSYSRKSIERKRSGKVIFKQAPNGDTVPCSWLLSNKTWPSLVQLLLCGWKQSLSSTLAQFVTNFSHYTRPRQRWKQESVQNVMSVFAHINIFIFWEIKMTPQNRIFCTPCKSLSLMSMDRNTAP